MTSDEEHVAALKALLGRIRGNADGRLVARTGDEEEFVPRSVREARAAQQAAAREAAATEAAEAEAAATEAAATEATARDAAATEAAARDAAAPEALVVAEARGTVAPVLESSPPIELDLFDPFEDELLGGASDHGAPLDEESFEGPRRQSRVPTATPSGVIATVAPAPSGAARDPFDGFDALGDGLAEDFDDELPDDGGPVAGDAVPTRIVDPLAVTAQNAVPAMSFERAASERAVSGEHAVAGGAALDDAPSSSPRPVDPDVAADEGLDSEPPPESGEVPSQRFAGPSSAPHGDLDLDAPTATGESERLARAIEDRFRDHAAIAAEPVAAAPPSAPPSVVGRPPLAATTFLEVLDAALALGEP